MMRRLFVYLLTFAVLLPAAAAAQDPAIPPTQPERSDPDVRLDPLQPDFALGGLPTTLRMPRGKWAFRVTHRFTRELGSGDFGDLASDLFGLDGGSQVGLEVRYGLLTGTQIGVHRTSDRTIQVFGQQSLMTQRDGRHAIGLDAIVTLEGWDNLTEQHQSALGVVASRNIGKWATIYAEPIFVLNTNPFDTGDENTLMLGLGTRVRVRPSTYITAEYSPRMTGYAPGDALIGFGLEMRAGGHLFQINISDGWGTTLGQIATGGIDYENWYLGFNISRKFF
jgi:Membrane bound beta barrel domain (DUF5777)